MKRLDTVSPCLYQFGKGIDIEGEWLSLITAVTIKPHCFKLLMLKSISLHNQDPLIDTSAQDFIT